MNELNCFSVNKTRQVLALASQNLEQAHQLDHVKPNKPDSTPHSSARTDENQPISTDFQNHYEI